MASSSPPRPPRRALSPIYSAPSTPPPDIPESQKAKSALDQVAALLRQLLRITVNDGRVFIGTFAGTDKPLNIILINAEEFRIGPGQNAEGRYVGQIMLPWKVIVKVEANVQEKPKPADGMYIWQVEQRLASLSFWLICHQTIHSPFICPETQSTISWPSSNPMAALVAILDNKPKLRL